MERDTVETIPPSLQPLSNSHEFDQLEHDLKQMFMGLFEDYLRAGERDLNVYGAPHLGSFDLVSESVKSDGLSLINNDDEPAMRYLHKAWRGRNPKRGLHFLNAYLSMLFSGHEVDQLWQRKDAEYPTSLLPIYRIKDDIQNYYLTSRLAVFVRFNGLPEEILKITPAIRSAMPARMVLDVGVLVPSSTTLAIGQSISVSASVDEEWQALPIGFRGNDGEISTGSALALSLSHDSELDATPIGIRNTDSDLPIGGAVSISASFDVDSNPRPAQARGNLSSLPLYGAVSISASFDWSFTSASFDVDSNPRPAQARGNLSNLPMGGAVSISASFDWSFT